MVTPVNIILVLGSERLYSEMNRRFASNTSSGQAVTVVKLDKSGGCVDRDDAFMRQSQELAIREYFFGDSKRTLSPHTQNVNFDDITIYRIREGKNPHPSIFLTCYILLQSHMKPPFPHFLLSQFIKILTHPSATSINTSFLPGGDTSAEDSTPQSIYEKVEPSGMLLHCIFAVMYATLRDTQETIRDASVMGFVYVTEVDEKKKRLKILAPLSTRITDRPMVWGTWPESSVSLI